MNDNEQNSPNIYPNSLSVVDLDVKPFQMQTSLDKAFSEMFSQINLEKKTEFLQNNEIKKLGTLYTMGKHYGFIALQERIIKHMEMRISLKRRGRSELVDMIKAEREYESAKLALEKHGRQGQ